MDFFVNSASAVRNLLQQWKITVVLAIVVAGGVFAQEQFSPLVHVHPYLVGTSYPVPGGVNLATTVNGGYAMTLLIGDDYHAEGIDACLIKFDSSGTLDWARVLQGDNYSDDGISGVAQTSDGGVVVTGIVGGVFGGFPGLGWDNRSGDVFLSKFSADGDQEWSRTIGGENLDRGFSVIQTADGGYAITGETWSFGEGDKDAFLAKFNTSGTCEWFRTIGTTGPDDGYSLVQSGDGEYILAGTSGTGVRLVKFDTDGNYQWHRDLLGPDFEGEQSLTQTEDGGFALTGTCTSSGSDDADMYLMKFNPNGGPEWSRTIGWESDDEGHSVRQTADGGYILSGTQNAPGESDAFMIKLHASGDVEWSQVIGGGMNDFGYAVFPTAEGYVLSIVTQSYASSSAEPALLPFDSQGNLCTGLISASDTTSAEARVFNPQLIVPPVVVMSYDSMDLVRNISINNTIVNLNTTDLCALVSADQSVSPSVARIDVWPNPMDMSCTIVAPAGAEIRIFSTQGSLVERIQMPEWSEGYRWTPAAHVAGGVYTIHVVSTDGQIGTNQVVLMR